MAEQWKFWWKGNWNELDSEIPTPVDPRQFAEEYIAFLSSDTMIYPPQTNPYEMTELIVISNFEILLTIFSPHQMDLNVLRFKRM